VEGLVRVTEKVHLWLMLNVVLCIRTLVLVRWTVLLSSTLNTTLEVDKRRGLPSITDLKGSRPARLRKDRRNSSRFEVRERGDLEGREVF
jgi:hypothetical protein